MLAILLLPFATLYTACSHQRIDTVNGYQVLAPHTYPVTASDGSTKLVSVGVDGFGWVVVALVALGIVLSLVAPRTLWLVATAVAGITALFLMVTAAGGSAASSKAEAGFWLSAIAMALAPSADVRPWRRAAVVALVTALLAAALVLFLVGLIALSTRGRT